MVSPGVSKEAQKGWVATVIEFSGVRTISHGKKDMIGPTENGRNLSRWDF